MIKKLSCMLLALVMVFGCTGVIAAADSERVEISFCVGDETLIINGEPVVVEKPYVVGAGVTLVPLRVITEAFGATVEWIGETKTINLTYDDVKIVLQIDNPVAEINGRAEELLAAPELTPNGFTVVPLRFISENFGAEVSYDEATKKITVIKEKSVTGGQTVEGGIETTYVGDSYFKWYMETPKDMTMVERRFDGRFTEFAYDENNAFVIIVVNMLDNYDFEKTFADLKASAEGMTLVKADKNSDEKTIYIQYKDKNNTYDDCVIFGDKYAFKIQSIFENSKEEYKNNVQKIIASFKKGYIFEDIYDLSNVKSGVRRFESEELNLSIDIPGEYVMVSDADSFNSFEFVSGDNNGELSARVSIQVYSKDSVGGAEKLANSDLERNSNEINSEISTFSDKLSRASYNSIYTTTYQYEYEINALAYKTYTRDVFFELGEYVYNIAVTILQPGDKKQVDDIINSLSAKEIDHSVVGDIIYNNEIITDTYEVSDLNKCSFNLPVAYDEVEITPNEVSYSDGVNLFVGSFIAAQDSMGYEFADLEYTATQYATSGAAERGEKHIKTAEEKLGDKDYIVLTLKKTLGTTVTYSEVYFTIHNGNAYIFTVLYSELSYSERYREEIRDVFKTAKYKD